MDKLNKDAYILVAVDKRSKFPTVKVGSNTTADVAKKRMHRNDGVPRKLRCDQAQTFRAMKKFPLFKSNNIKKIFTPVDDHRSMGVIERLIEKSRLGLCK